MLAIHLPYAFQDPHGSKTNRVAFLTVSSDNQYKKALQFDFYLPERNACIEYDGKQHYEPVDYFGGEKAFRLSLIRDGIKTAYCKEKGIPLLRIPYWDRGNINSILKEHLEESK